MRKLFIALVMGSALLPLDGFTLGLGGIEVNSALNQELDAEIELLSAVPEDTETMIVKLATREEFSRAGLDRPFMLQSLKFGSKIKNGVPYITVTTSKPIREPFLNFLVEVDWPKGHLLREYTILLDPPVFMGQQSAARPAVSDSRPAAASAVRPTDTSSRPAYSTTPAVTPAPAPRSQASPAAAPAPRATYTPAGNADYRIKKGDTAWSLADALRPDQSVSVEQMMLAMLRTNPESFINDNVNGLKRGYILRVPDRNEITSVSQAEAVALVRQQHALWREYQQAVSSAKPSSTMAGSAAGSPAADAKADARLSIVSAGKGGAATGAAGNLGDMSVEELRAQLALAEERLETERVEKESLQGEVEILESQVNRMKRLLSIEDVSLAEMQSAAAGGEVAEGMDAELAADESDELLTSAEDAMPSEGMPLEEMPAEETAALAEGEAESDMLTDEQAENVFVDEQQAAQEMMDAAPMQETYVDEAPVIDFVQPQPQGLVANLLNNPLVLAAAGGGLLLIMGLVYMIVKRRRGNASGMAAAPVVAATSSVLDEDDDLASVADMIDDKAVSQHVSDEEVDASMAAAEEAAEKFDSDATLVLPPSAEDTIVTQAAPAEEARDDIIAEADVYLAYGIYQQAEELLQNAIKEHPENDAYRMKLAETHFASKNASAFGELATEMHKRTGGSGASWTKIAAMGADLIPDHALFKGADMVGDLALDDLVPSAAPEMDFDLGAETATDEVADLDFSLDDDTSSDAALPDLGDNTPASAEEELEFDLSDAEAVKLDEAAPAEDEFSLDIEASELDITSDEANKDTAADLDFDLDLSDEAAAPAADTAADMDFDLDLSNEVEEVAQSVSDTASVSADTDDGSDIDLSDLDDVDEVSTKLDLARAYLDMGDSEGTRSILEEVIAEGNDEQKSEAQGLLAELSA